mgnify:CR=1 FL=1
MQVINLPPYAPTLITSTRAIGYSLETAVADIIDNSIAAAANNIDICFFPVNDAYIAVLDNGHGMNENELNCAMQYGSRSPLEHRDKNDLGRFGLGLKTASLSQCRVLTVVTKQQNSVFARRWDIDHVTATGSWSLLILEDNDIARVPQIEKLKQYDSGTLVVWQKLDRLQAGEINFEQMLGRKIDRVRDHLALIYHRYLSGEPGIVKLQLNINGEKVFPADPFLRNKSIKAMDDESLVIRGHKVIVRSFILPHVSKLNAAEIESLGGKEGLRRQQGFYIYRNKRLLVWGTWFRMMRQGDLSKLARVQVDIPNTLDDLWTLDVKKSSAVPPAEVRQNLEAIIEKIAERSKRTWTFRGKKETDDTAVHMWNRMKSSHGGYYYEINRDHPFIKQILKNFNTETHHMIEVLLRQIEICIPLNQLYVDLNNDEQIINDTGIDENEALAALQKMISSIPNQALKYEFLAKMKTIIPFAHFPSVFEKLEKETSANG